MTASHNIKNVLKFFMIFMIMGLNDFLVGLVIHTMMVINNFLTFLYIVFNISIKGLLKKSIYNTIFLCQSENITLLIKTESSILFTIIKYVITKNSKFVFWVFTNIVSTENKQKEMNTQIRNEFTASQWNRSI